MTHKIRSLIAVAAILVSGVSWAQSTETKMDQSKLDHSSMDHSKMGQPLPADATAATKAYIEANAKMHADMAMSFTGDADADFIAGMLPHHQGAVDMAKIVLLYGQDPEVKKLAEGIIKAQNEEIAWMKSWQEKRAKSAK